jgi:hypothetical protein
MLLKHKFMQEAEDLGILTVVSKVEYTLLKSMYIDIILRRYTY